MFYLKGNAFNTFVSLIKNAEQKHNICTKTPQGAFKCAICICFSRKAFQN